MRDWGLGRVADPEVFCLSVSGSDFPNAPNPNPPLGKSCTGINYLLLRICDQKWTINGLLNLYVNLTFIIYLSIISQRN
jgi:hypothetical protein